LVVVVAEPVGEMTLTEAPAIGACVLLSTTVPLRFPVCPPAANTGDVDQESSENISPATPSVLRVI